MENPANPEKTAREVLGDYVKEIVGYENGTLRTLIDLRKQPDVVLKGYLAKDNKYISPFRLLISALSLWVLVNSFFLDWKKAFTKALRTLIDFEVSLLPPIKPEKLAEFNVKMDHMIDMLSTFGGDMYSKYLVPFVLIILPLGTFLAALKCKKLGVDFKTILATFAYSSTGNILLMFILSFIAYFSLIVFLLVALTLFVIQFLSRRNVFMLAPPRKFFSEHGLEIEKTMMKSAFFASLIIALLIIIFGKYTIFSNG